MTTQRVAQAALFVSLMTVTGVLIGVCGALWAHEYAIKRVRESARLQRIYTDKLIRYDGTTPGKRSK